MPQVKYTEIEFVLEWHSEPFLPRQIHSHIDCPEYRNLFIVLRDLKPGKRLAPVALDLPKSKYAGKISRDESTAKSIEKIFKKNSNAKMLVVVGNNRVLKKLDWQDHVPDKTVSIREYLIRKVLNLSAFSIGQLIDEDPSVCDFTKKFGPIEGFVAFDCDWQSFKGWKIGVTSAIAIKDTEPCEPFDGLIVY